ncbi:arsenate reductase (glutaredoxin) [Pseudomonas sp. F1_0610]|uniref:arsenate reductase (glutaredoxin) n=1 Tax=Pseudomonas sp. F1_0610 TaxID=3114284 RepID=UPI0039C1F378
MTNSITLYHNNRCSKSRAALALLEERQLQANVVYYLETPPSEQEISALLQKLGMKARDLLRNKEDEFTTLGLANTQLTEAQLITAMHKHPRLIERPILVVGDKAVIGRPTENLLEILP